LIRSGNRLWIWHPPTCFFSALGVLWGIQTHLFSKDKKLIHKLQPRQELRAKE
jgi:hypothetical protein